MTDFNAPFPKSTWPAGSLTPLHEVLAAENPVLSSTASPYPGQTIETDDAWMEKAEVW